MSSNLIESIGFLAKKLIS